jgi:hypothetical protein
MQTVGPFRGLGARFTIASHDPALTAALGELYAPLAAPAAADGSSAVPIVLAPPTPGEPWTLSVDRRVVVRSSTAGGAVRMLLRSVEDLLRREHDDPDQPVAEPASTLHLSAAAIEVAGRGTLLLTDHHSDRDALLACLLHDHEDVRYLGAAAVHLGVGDLGLSSAATPLALHRDHWESLAALGEFVPPGVHPYLDLVWPLPAAALGAIADHTHLEVVCLLEASDDAEVAPFRAGEGVVPIGPAVCVTRLLDRLPAQERTGLPRQRLEQVASVVERVATISVTSVADPIADATAVLTAVRQAPRVLPTRAAHRAVASVTPAGPGASW